MAYSNRVTDESFASLTTATKVIEKETGVLEWTITNNGSEPAMVRFDAVASATSGHLLAAGQSVTSKQLSVYVDVDVYVYADSATDIFVTRFLEIN